MCPVPVPVELSRLLSLLHAPSYRRKAGASFPSTSWLLLLRDMKRKTEELTGTSRPSSRHRPSFKNVSMKCSYQNTEPFANGAFRNVYRGQYTEGLQAGDPCVVKKFIKGCVYEDQYFAEDGCKDVLKVVKYKELFENLGDDDRSTLHKYAREKSESLRLSLKRARED